MTFYWMHPSWKKACCQTCGVNIWDAGGDPDWGHCYGCYNDQIEYEQQLDRDYNEYMDREYQRYCEKERKAYLRNWRKRLRKTLKRLTSIHRHSRTK